MAVIVIVGVLGSLILPALVHARDSARGTVCRSNLRQLSIGAMNYADDNGNTLPWCGGSDRNLPADWVFGGQPLADLSNPLLWKSQSFGLHAESGSLFPYVTGGQRVAYDENIRTVYSVYQCPSSGALGAAVRVNFALNGWVDGSARPGIGPRGVTTAEVTHAADKVLFTNEDPQSMRNAAFMPGDPSSSGAFVDHEGRANFSFMDAHVESLRKREVLRITTPQLRDYFFHAYK